MAEKTVWETRDLRGLIFQFLSSPQRVYMVDKPKLPFIRLPGDAESSCLPECSLYVPCWNTSAAWVRMYRRWYNRMHRPYSYEVEALVDAAYPELHIHTVHR
jgi:hypothetical protein